MFMLLASALLTFHLGDSSLQSGKVLPNCKVTYRTYGKLNAVIVVDALGNGNSTSPSNSVLKGSKFPGIRIADMVESQRRLVKELRIERVHAIVGVSMGGMQVFHWMVAHPELLKKAVLIVSTPKMTEKDVQLWSKAVPIGRPAPEAKEKQKGFSLDKVLGVVSAGLSQYRKYEQPFNPLRQFEAMVAHDIFKHAGGSVESAARTIRAAALVIVANKDNALTTDLSVKMAELLAAPLIRLDGPCGHKAYDCELDKISEPIAKFLE